MVAVGRGYLLTLEPALLVRAQAADIQLWHIIQKLVSRGHADDENRHLVSLVASAKRHREVFAGLVSGPPALREPREVATAIRDQLIPARDELVAALDALVARRHAQLESLRASEGEVRSRILRTMLVLGVLFAIINILLARLVLARARNLSAPRFQIVASLAGRDDRLASTYRHSRRAFPVRPRG
jgi:hypothetical protein